MFELLNVSGVYLTPDGEYLKGGELEEYMRQVVTTGPLQEAGPETLPPKDIMRYFRFLSLPLFLFSPTLTLFHPCCMYHIDSLSP